MVDFKQIYKTQADAYDRMVRYEDYQKNINRVLSETLPKPGQQMVELGAGTGRLSRILAPEAAHFIACDVSYPMLKIAKASVEGSHCTFLVADNRHMPIRKHSADVAVAGWSLGHSVGWYPQKWQDEIGQALQEMQRILKPGGTIIIFETMGTGVQSPAPPTEGLAHFYQWLKNDHHFNTTIISTDYYFPSAEVAEQSIRFFFGDTLADHIRREKINIVPEYTGLWWKRV